ncbi:hypothetical protein NEIG_02512 [Nematocida sp. ERTm5]|nr:hypothetical protein NEIRO02_2411 [Nematocida sp. AWRm79]KAI5186057.1 hypothetical protein NEIRO03_2185 [Nematocida sp. AWRm78]OAG33224.1 hypothetical protein NEIG_02512 [Nematocida sp. ERTm5]
MSEIASGMVGVYLLPISAVVVYLVGKYILHLRDYPVAKELSFSVSHNKEKKE